MNNSQSNDVFVRARDAAVAEYDRLRYEALMKMERARDEWLKSHSDAEKQGWKEFCAETEAEYASSVCKAWETYQESVTIGTILAWLDQQAE